MRRTLSIAAAIILTLGVAVRPAQSQSLPINTSLDAFCVGGDCSTMQFHLNTPDGTAIEEVSIVSGSTLWRFGTLITVLDVDGNDVTSNWVGSLVEGVGDELKIQSLATPASPAPITLTVNMTAWSTWETLDEASMMYNGQGISALDKEIHFGGQVAPEPSTWILLLTGLLGIGFVAWRRRRNENAELEAMAA